MENPDTKVFIECYAACIWKTPEECLRHAQDLRQVDFDTFVVSGISGILAGQIFARHFRKHLLIVRKNGEKRHTQWPVQGVLGRRWVFLDDFVGAGKTFAFVCSKIRWATERTPESGQEGGWEMPEFESAYVGRFGYTLQWDVQHGWTPAIDETKDPIRHAIRKYDIKVAEKWRIEPRDTYQVIGNPHDTKSWIKQ